MHHYHNTKKKTNQKQKQNKKLKQYHNDHNKELYLLNEIHYKEHN